VSVVSARNLSKAYGPQTLFANIALTIRSGERVGLLGPNGAGKSTLLRVLAGIEPADGGVVDRQRDAQVLYLAQEPVLDPLATPRQLVAQGLAEWHRAMQQHAELTRRIEAGASEDALLTEQARVADLIEHLGGFTRDHIGLEMLQHLGVRDTDRAVGTMSGGERRRVALAQLLVSQPALAILDEPTNHLDTETIEWLEEYLVSQYAGAVLMVTHDRYVLDAVADRVLELDRGNLIEFEGGYADYLEQKAELEAHAERTESNRQNLLRRERAWLMRGARARSTKQKARLSRAQTLVATAAPKEAARASFSGLERGGARLGKTILDLEDVTLELGGKTLVRDLTLRLVAGDRVGILGPNGAGKTSLLRLVADELAPARGTVVRGANTEMTYFDQTRSQLVDAWSVFDNVAEREGAERTGAGMVRIGERLIEMRTYLEQFLFEGSKQRQKVSALSGGERARVALAKALKSGANMLLLDEPTNDLDVETLGALEELLETWPGCALIVSHDRYFLDRIATSTLAFEGDGVWTRYPGGYESYRTLRRETVLLAAQASRKVNTPAEPPQPVESAQAKPLSFAERKELEGILDEIGALEGTLSARQAQMADPALYTRSPEDAKRVRAEHAAAELKLTERMTRWEDLEARRDTKRR